MTNWISVDERLPEVDQSCRNHAVIGYQHGASDRVFSTIDECLDDAKTWVSDKMESLNIYQVMLNQVAKCDYVPAKV